MRYSKKLRRQIVEEFASRHDGEWSPELFLQEVRAQGEDHPAYEWFEWDKDKAAYAHWTWQARQFGDGIIVSRRVEEMRPESQISIRHVEVPLAVSPVAGRKDGGGYYIFDPQNQEHMEELCRQAARDLKAWIKRYRAAVIHAEGSVEAIEDQIHSLEAVEERAMAGSAGGTWSGMTDHLPPPMHASGSDEEQG